MKVPKPSALRRPKLPKKLTFEKVQAYKEAMRAYDRARIAAGIATPAEVQEENSICPKPEKVTIQSFPELEPCV